MMRPNIGGELVRMQLADLRERVGHPRRPIRRPRRRRS